MGETRAELPFTGDQVGLFRAQPDRPPLALASLNLACRDQVPTFPQRSPPSLLTTAACGGLRPAPDCRPRRALLHLSYSSALSYSDSAFVTHAPNPTLPDARQFIRSPLKTVIQTT